MVALSVGRDEDGEDGCGPLFFGGDGFCSIRKMMRFDGEDDEPLLIFLFSIF